jgi:hypothetical protein
LRSGQSRSNDSPTLTGADLAHVECPARPCSLARVRRSRSVHLPGSSMGAACCSSATISHHRCTITQANRRRATQVQLRASVEMHPTGQRRLPRDACPRHHLTEQASRVRTTNEGTALLLWSRASREMESLFRPGSSSISRIRAFHPPAIKSRSWCLSQFRWNRAVTRRSVGAWHIGPCVASAHGLPWNL